MVECVRVCVLILVVYVEYIIGVSGYCRSFFPLPLPRPRLAAAGVDFPSAALAAPRARPPRGLPGRPRSEAPLPSSGNCSFTAAVKLVICCIRCCTGCG